MSWLRVDDGFMIHPKIAELSDKNFRIWMRILTFCARNSSPDGALTGAKKELRGVTDKVIEQFVAARLIDVGTDGVMRVHDWCDYAPKRSDPTNAARQAKWREAQRDVTVPTVTNTPYNVTPPARAVPGPSRPVTTEPKGSSVAAAPRRREPDPLWESISEMCGKSTGSLRGKVVASLRGQGATADDVRERFGLLQRRWPDITITDTTLLKHWGLAIMPLPPGEKKGAMSLADDIRASSEGALRILESRRNGHVPITADLELEALDA